MRHSGLAGLRTKARSVYRLLETAIGSGEAEEALLTLRGRRDEIFANCHVDAVCGVPLPHAFQNRDEDVFAVGGRTSRSKEMGWRVSWDAEVRRLSLWGLSQSGRNGPLQLMIT